MLGHERGLLQAQCLRKIPSSIGSRPIIHTAVSLCASPTGLITPTAATDRVRCIMVRPPAMRRKERLAELAPHRLKLDVLHSAVAFWTVVHVIDVTFSFTFLGQTRERVI